MTLRKPAENGAAHRGLDTPRIRAGLICLEGAKFFTPGLSPFGIDVRELATSGGLESGTAAICDVVLLRCSGDALSEASSSAIRKLTEEAVGLGMSVCFVLDAPTADVRPWFAAGADAVAFADQSAALLSVAVFTAHNSGVVRRSCRRQVSDLEKKLEETRLINHAKTLMAKQLNICELDALQRLRKESRSQRRPMAQLAKIIIEAHEILVGKPSGSAAQSAGGKSQKLPEELELEASHRESEEV